MNGMRLRRWWPLLLGAFATVAFGLWIAWRARQPEFAFLAGRAPLEAPHNVPQLLGVGPQDPIFILVPYAFPSDYSNVVKEADSQLVSAGWSKTHDSDSAYDGGIKPHTVDTVYYQEPGADGRFVMIESNCSRPEMEESSDLIDSATYRPGWVAVQVSYPPARRDWKDRAISWLGKVFLGRP